MFQATKRPSSGAQTVIATSGFTYILVAGRCDGSAIAAAGNQKHNKFYYMVASCSFFL
jgi:hypothetical protein